MSRIACTIVSANYLHFAWTLAESFLKLHPDDEFHLLLVDHKPDDFVLVDKRVHVLDVEKLDIVNFRSVAFKFDITELNTGVKPTFLKYLFTLGAQKVIYFDPDIYLFHSVDFIYTALEEASLVLTPHILTPTPDVEHVYEKDFLGTGVFNLGFVAVSNSPQGRAFLDWWEQRCLDYCYEDLRSGLFVDQKWINLAPCLFDGTQILRHPGCNVAYWNLQERSVSEDERGYMVSGPMIAEPVSLIFFHYSGYRPNIPERLSAKLRLPYLIDPTIKRMLVFYGERLQANGADTYQRYAYTYQTFSNGTLISLLARRLYSVTLDKWKDQDPFQAQGAFFKKAKETGLLSKQDQSGQFSSNNLATNDWRLRIINRILFSLLKLVGADKYTMLMKYLSFISILRNQRQLLFAEDNPRSKTR